MKLYDQIMDPDLSIRRVGIAANHVTKEEKQESYEQLSLFTDYEAEEKQKAATQRERKMQTAILELQKKFGKNAVLKGMDLEEGATTIARNGQIGGHKA